MTGGGDAPGAARAPAAGIRRPRTCIWEITGACDLRCLHCGNRSGTRHPRELGWDELCEVAASLARLGCRTVELTGGEPLLRPDWERLSRRCADLGLQVALVTNGLGLDDETLERALAAGVGHVAISLDGPREVHDALRVRARPGPSPFDGAVAALRRASARLPTTAITAVTRGNLPLLPELHRLLAELGVPRWQVQLAVPTGRVREAPEPLAIRPADLEGLERLLAGWIEEGSPPHVMVSDSIGYGTELEPALRRRPTGQGMWLGCLAGIRSVAITYDGRVRGCSFLPEAFDAGDLHDESLEAIWSDPERFGVRQRLAEPRLEGGCADCPEGRVCRAGCASMAWWTTGSLYDNPYCLRRVRKEPA
ncbi:MAG: radical SAM protein [Deltaproteobacteria bacterium]|nr:radical SAM protein [Deltaproteobacteria bacterium]